MTNKEIAAVFYDIADFLQMQGVAFKPRAYQKAAATIENHPTPLSEMYEKCGRSCIDELPGIGESMLEKIEELVKTGRLRVYEQLQKKFPFDMHALTQVEGVGPKTAFKLYKKLHVKTLRDLEAVAKAGKIRTVPGFGKKTEENILDALGFLAKSKGRILLGDVLPYAEAIVEKLRKVPGVTHADIAGSIRRRRETIGDIDLLVTTTNHTLLVETFKQLPEIDRVVEEGPKDIAVKYNIGLNGDLMVLPPEVYGAGLIHFTGSKYHNIQIRTLAIKKGWKLSELGLMDGKKRVAGRTEEEVYKKLGMQWMPPEIREASGEVELALKKKIPELVSYGSLKGDLQVQTNWTDGQSSIADMATAAKKAGLSYIAITDHTKDLAMTRGLDETRLAKQGQEIDRLNKAMNGFRILKGSEVNILKDGRLDLSDHALSKLDVVAVAVHSHFKMPEAEMTERIIRAMKHPSVHILFHPTGRKLHQRSPYAADIERIVRAAKQFRVALEINGDPSRLDLDDVYIRLAVQNKVKCVIDSDAHAPSHYRFLDLGIAQARRGWATKADILNTLSVDALLKAIKK